MGMMAIMMSNAGGAWDNSKKYIEIAGAHDGKGTDVHKACVVGDTVGDPFKDTSGPALNILLKLMAMVSLVIGNLLKGFDDWEIGYYATIPGVILLGTTYVYVKFLYSDKLEGLDEDDSKKGDDKPKSPNQRKNTAFKEEDEEEKYLGVPDHELPEDHPRYKPKEQNKDNQEKKEDSFYTKGKEKGTDVELASVSAPEPAPE